MMAGISGTSTFSSFNAKSSCRCVTLDHETKFVHSPDLVSDNSFRRGLARRKAIMIGCDLHDGTMRIKIAAGPGKAVTKSFATVGMHTMIAGLKEFAARQGVSRIVLAYEASGQWFGLYVALADAGMECDVLAPTHLPHSAHGRANKTDDKDAQRSWMRYGPTFWQAASWRRSGSPILKRTTIAKSCGCAWRRKKLGRLPG
jgi:hypothetical protein